MQNAQVYVREHRRLKIRLQVTELSLKMRLLKNTKYKKRKFWPVSDPDPNPGYGSRSKSGIRIRIRIWIRIRIQNLPQAGSGSETGSETFVSIPQHCKNFIRETMKRTRNQNTVIQKFLVRAHCTLTQPCYKNVVKDTEKTILWLDH